STGASRSPARCVSATRSECSSAPETAMSARKGFFWDVMEGRRPPPPAAALLGFELLAIDPEQGTIRVRFTARPEFANPIGVVQGGFLAAMLDDALGPALTATLEPDQFAPTIELKVN